jgi:hypothetical protein
VFGISSKYQTKIEHVLVLQALGFDPEGMRLWDTSDFPLIDTCVLKVSHPAIDIDSDPGVTQRFGDFVNNMNKLLVEQSNTFHEMFAANPLLKAFVKRL